MTKYDQADQIRQIIDDANKIVVVQADNPDTDSLASSLALEQILGDMGKEVIMYCGVELPSYLTYLSGSDRVVTEIPTQFDASIVVDTSSDTLLEQLDKAGFKAWLASRPAIIIDHHSTEPTVTFANVILNTPAVATTEVIYELAGQLGWTANQEAKEFIAIGILSDSLGLTTESTTARSIHVIAEIVDSGVSLAKIENARRETMRRERELIPYKGRLLERVEYQWEEIEKFSPLYNPPMLVLDDMRLAKGCDIAIAFKLYREGKITGKIRANFGRGIADKLAEHFGGGGHAYAAGFKIQGGKSYEELKNEVIDVAGRLLDELGQ
jgi:phosphoesterase RecJ-like protein